jgi:hypothetical protein
VSTAASHVRDRGWRLPAILVAAAVFIWTVPLQLIPLWTKNQINPDVNLYRIYAGAIAHGWMPYRDFRIEYPPGATGLFSLVWWIPGQYTNDFSALMLLCLCVCLVGVVSTARALGYSPVRQAVAGGIVAAAPLVLGSIVTARFDLAVAAIVAWMLYCAVTERWRWMWVLLAAGVLVKLVPLALIPMLIVWQARRVDWRAALTGAAAACAAVALVVLPFAIISPSGTWYFIAYNMRRPPQFESLVASAFVAAHTVAGTGISVAFTYGSFNVDGSLARVAALVVTGILIALVGVIAIRCARLLMRAYPSRAAEVLVTGAAATMVSLTVSGKVLSPQYMIWLLPVIPLVGGRTWRAATAVFVAVLVLTQMEFPIYYFNLIDYHPHAVLLLVARNIGLVVLLVLCWPRRGLGELPIGGRLVGTVRRDRDASVPPSSISARHIVD